MKKKFMLTALWMIVFASVTFSIGPIILAVLVFSRVMPDATIEHVLWVWRVLFFFSPLAALLLGLREALPGTRPLALNSRYSNAMPIILTIIMVAMGILYARVAWLAIQPPAGRPNVSIALLGYTNDLDGTRLAKLAVTNLNASTVFAYQAVIEIPGTEASGGISNYNSGTNSSWHAELRSGASEMFTIATPTNQSPWRLRIFVYPDRGANRVFIKRVVGITCLSLGVMPRYVRHPYDIEGDWIQSEK